jgi:tRNA-2-methylthio-N6-dimethylallyladenosine synthase
VPRARRTRRAEITLLGQIVTSYGRRDYAHTGGVTPFVQLLERVHAIDGLERIRFTSPHPRGFKHDLVEAYGRLPKLCGYVHLPMQSGSNRILRAMNRPYTRERYLEIVDALRAVRPDMYFSTDVIVGFPGRDRGGFRADARAVRGRELRHGLHLQVFHPHRHARRDDGGSGAGGGEGGAQPDPARLLEQNSRRRNQALLGTVQEVLVEGPTRRACATWAAPAATARCI